MTKNSTPRRWAAIMLLAAVAAGSFYGSAMATGVQATPVAPSPTVAVEGTPDWVRDRTPPTATPARITVAQDGTAYLLNDAQYRVRADGHDDWFRLISKVVNRSGLESAGQITLAYDPAFETVGVAFIRIIRDGKVIDLTRDTQFRIVERESELKDGIVSGTLKVMANLRDVRVGDVVDYATIVHTRSGLWPGEGFFQFSQRFSDPLAMRAIRLVWPIGMTPLAKPLNSDIAFQTRKVDGGGFEWEWTVQDPLAIKGESDVPDGAFQWGRVDVSTMKSWADLAGWASGLYVGDETLPPDFISQLDVIAKASASPADRLTAALRYVQDNIRYVGEEMGEGAFAPRRPKIVLARGYGDCKDKSLLLAVALRRLGIDAVPALVSTSAGERLPDRLPSPSLFDHVITRAVIDGRVMWIDPTGTHRGGRGTAIVASNLSYALPIRAGQSSLEKVEGFADHAGRMIVVEQFAIDEKDATPMTLHVETRFTEARADRVRARWASGSAQTIADGNLDFYRKRFPGIVETRPLALTDDRDANVLTMVEEYSLSRVAFDKAKLSAKFITRAYALQNILPDRQASPRRNPLALPDHILNEQTIELRAKDRMLEPLPDIDVKDGGIAFARTSTKLPDGLRMVYRLDTGTRDAVPPDKAEAVYTLSDKLGDETGIEFYFENSPRPSEMPAGLDPATMETLKPELAKVQTLIQKPDQASKIEALTLISGIADRLPRPSPAAGLIDGVKGAVLAALLRPQPALAALRSGTAQYDGNPNVFRLWIGYEIDLGTAETIAKALQRTLAVQPDVVGTLDENWVRASLQKAQGLSSENRTKVRDDMCLALVGAGWQQSPRSSFGDIILSCSILAHARRGQSAEVRALLAKDPPTASMVALASERRYQTLWPDMDRLGADHFRKALEGDAKRAGVAARAAPTDYKTVARYMQSLRALGRFDEAIAAGKALASDRAKIEMVGTDAFWLVNEYAANLHMAGEIDGAIAAMEMVIGLGIEQYPELASLAINRAELQIASGKYQAGIDSLTALDPKHLSAYGQMWIWSNRACALYRLDRLEEAKADEARLAGKPADNWGAVTRAAACRGDVKAAADLLVTRLHDEEARPGVLEQFLSFDTAEAVTPTEQVMLQTLAEARATPRVQAEFAKYGRSVRYAGTTQGWATY